MKKNNDPAELFNQISASKVKYNKPGQAMIEDDKFIAVVVMQAPDMYQGVLTKEQQQKPNDVTLANVQEAMTMQF